MKAATLLDIRSIIHMSVRLQRDVERCFVICAWLLFPGSTVVWPGIMLILFAMTGVWLAWHWRTVRAGLNYRVGMLLLPGALAMGSVWWSIDPGVSIYRALALLGTTVFGGFVALRFSLREQLQLVALMLGMVASASLLVALLMPEYGVMTEPLAGAWSGIFYHKNPFGRMMALAALVFSLLAFESGRMRAMAILGLGLSVGLIVASTSRAAMVVGLTCLASMAILAVAQRLSRPHRFRLLCLATAMIICLGVWGGPQAERFLGLLSKDLTFTGRTELWAVLLDKVQLYPWLGYGYGAFWRGSETGVSGEVYEAVKWYPIHAHNGFLDLMLDLGLLGLVMVLGLLVLYGRQALSWGMAQRSLLALWPSLYLLFFILSNLVESSLVRENSIYWALYVSAVVTVQQDPACNL